MSETLTRHDENGRRIVPANILVRSMVRPTRMLAGTGIFKGVRSNVYNDRSQNARKDRVY